MRGALLRIYVVLIALLMVLPVAVVLSTSLTPESFLQFPPHGFSLRWYQALMADDEWADAISTSVRTGALVTLFSLTLGIPAALGLHRSTGSSAAALQLLFLSPLMIPSLVIGVALLRLYSSLGLSASLTSLALGQTMIATPYVVRFVLASLAGVDPTLERAARILGCGRIRSFGKVTLPLIRHGVIAGAIFSFIVSLDDVNVALFLSDIHVSPLSVQLLNYVQQSADPLGAAVASLLVIIAFVLIAACDRMVGIDWLFGMRKTA